MQRATTPKTGPKRLRFQRLYPSWNQPGETDCEPLPPCCRHFSRLLSAETRPTGSHPVSPTTQREAGCTLVPFEGKLVVQQPAFRLLHCVTPMGGVGRRNTRPGSDPKHYTDPEVLGGAVQGKENRGSLGFTHSDSSQTPCGCGQSCARDRPEKV